MYSFNHPKWVLNVCRFIIISPQIAGTELATIENITILMLSAFTKQIAVFLTKLFPATIGSVP